MVIDGPDGWFARICEDVHSEIFAFSLLFAAAISVPLCTFDIRSNEN